MQETWVRSLGWEDPLEEEMTSDSSIPELVRAGMIEELQREYKVTLAGPTTMSALLNSLQMGFRTLAIQKRSGEVWKVLGKVKTEFDTYKFPLYF